MIKQALLFVLMFIGALLLALASASLVLEKYIFNKANTSLMTSAVTNEFIMKSAINNVEKLDSQDYENIYKYSCLIISSPDTYIITMPYKDSPSKQQELLELKAKARNLEKSLKERNLCKI